MGRKICAWLGWILAAILLYFFENNTGTRAVLLISLLVPLLSMGCARMAAKRMTVTLQAPESVQAGESIRCKAQAHMTGWAAGCSAAWVLTGCNRLTGETFETEIHPDGRGDCVFEVESRRCGLIRLAVSCTEVRDWFALTKIRRDIRAEASVLVEPALYPVVLSAEPDNGACSREEGGNHRRAADPEPGNLREYMPGDDIRRIHWKLSEKLDRTMIRESVPEALDMPALLLETVFPGETDPEAMHAAARGLLSVSHAMAAEGISHAVFTADGTGTACTEVDDDADFYGAEQQVLTAVCTSGGADAGTLFSRETEDIRFRHVIVFSPHPGTDLSLTAERQPVTLVLPPFVPFAGAEAGIRVTTLDPADAAIDI